MTSLLTSLNYNDDIRLVGLAISRQKHVHRKGVALAVGMRTSWDIRNINEEAVAETVAESSGEVDSGRSDLYHSYGSSTKTASNVSTSPRSSSRICSHCGTSKTPLWRSGPQGPKSLCNACGIRLKKAGRRNPKNDLRAASLPPHGKSSSSPSLTSTYDHLTNITKKRRRSISRKEAEENASGNTSPRNIVPYYARCDAAQGLSQIKSSLAGFLGKTELARGLGLSDTDTRDEDGAILLMALSYGYLNA